VDAAGSIDVTRTGPVHGLVLSGGGAYAAYEVGVILALCRGHSPTTGFRPLDPQILCGTSAGSFNAAAFASWPGAAPNAVADWLAAVWLDRLADGPSGNGVYRVRGDPFGLLAAGPLWSAQFTQDLDYLARDFASRTGWALTAQTSLCGRLAQMVDLSTFIDSEPYRQSIREVIRPDAIRSNPRDLCIAVTEWRTGQLRKFSNADMTPETAGLVIEASSAIPGFFPPVQFGGEIFVDGGVLMTTPLLPAIEAGADFLHVIYLDPDVGVIPPARLQNLISSFERTLLIQRAGVINLDCKTVRRVNEGLHLIEQWRAGHRPSAIPRVAPEAVRSIGRPPDQRPLRKLTVHRYHPRTELGGIAGVLALDRERIRALIARGYQDTVDHDCGEAECILPEGKPAPFRFAHNAQRAELRRRLQESRSGLHAVRGGSAWLRPSNA